MSEPFIVSARKYRPNTFDTVVGQKSITSTLKNAIKNGQLAQAFLFTGPRGVGKTTCARILAKTINCENISENIEACNTCESCLSFNRSHSFNVHELDAASNNSVDGIRILVDQVRIPPQVGKYKVYIIDEVHMLSQAAFNAFLKTLEEPPAYAKFILATTERHKIIPTILSRCQIFDFARIRMEDITRQLQMVAEKEGIDAETNALHIIAQKADGAMRDALSIFDQLVSFSGNSLTYKQVIENLNVLDYDYYFRMVDLILEGKASQVLLLVNEIILKGFEGSDFITGFGQHLRNLLVSKDAATIKLLEVSDDLRANYMAQAKRAPEEFLLPALEINNRADVQYRGSSNKRLMLELALLQMTGLVKKKAHRDPLAADYPLPAPGGEAVQAKPVAVPVPPAAKSPPAPPPGLKVNPDPATPGPSPAERNQAPPAGIPAASFPASQETKDTGTPQEAPDASDEKQPGKETSAPAPPRLPQGVSLKIKLSGEEEEEEGDDLPEDGGNEPDERVSLSRFLETWNELARSVKEESQGLYLAMTKHEPEVSPEGRVIVTIDNVIQDGLIRERRGELLSHLRKNLSNYSIQIETRIMEGAAQQKAYLPKEKYERLIEKNPEVERLKKELDLDFDY